MSNTPQTEAQRLADWADDRAFSDAAYCNSEYNAIADELRRLDSVEQRHTEMMANPCPEWDGKAYMQAIANLRAQLAKAVAEERESIAKWYADEGWLLDEDDIPAAIRARSNT